MMTAEIWVLEWSFSQRAFHLRLALGPFPGWWPGQDWQPLAFGAAAALEALALELEEVWR